MARNEITNTPVALRHEGSVTGRGVCCNKLEGNASRSEASVDYKLGFLEVKAATLLSYALNADVPEGVATATGAQLVLLLRKNGITKDRLTFSIAREAV